MAWLKNKINCYGVIRIAINFIVENSSLAQNIHGRSETNLRLAEKLENTKTNSAKVYESQIQTNIF